MGQTGQWLLAATEELDRDEDFVFCSGSNVPTLFLKSTEDVFNIVARHDWLIDWCLTSSEQFFSYIQDENI